MAPRAQLALAFACTALFCLCATAQEPASPKPQAENAPAATEGAPSDAPAESDTAALAKAAQNPVSSMISLPFQYNANFGVERVEVDASAFFRRWFFGRLASNRFNADGSLEERTLGGISRKLFPLTDEHERTQHVLNIQPVYPIAAGNWNLINRLIVPVMYQPLGEDDEEVGLGDIQYTLLFSPADSGKVIWGLGPAIVMPTATDDVLGTGKWSAGPAVVVLTMPGRWVLGALAQNVWSFAGDSDRADVNQLLIQPFVNYNFNKGWYFSSSPIITANWEADGDERWTVPVGGGLGRVFKVGKQPLNASLGAYYNVEKPDGAADWAIRAQVQFMFPKK